MSNAWIQLYMFYVGSVLFYRLYLLSYLQGGIKMAEAKAKASTVAKQKYNKKVYDIIAVRVPKDTAMAFKAKCAAENISQAQVIKNAIAKFLNDQQKNIKIYRKNS